MIIIHYYYFVVVVVVVCFFVIVVVFHLMRRYSPILGPNFEPGAIEDFFAFVVTWWIGPSVECVPFPAMLSFEFPKGGYFLEFR